MYYQLHISKQHYTWLCQRIGNVILLSSNTLWHYPGLVHSSLQKISNALRNAKKNLLCRINNSFIHSIGMCRMRRFLAVLRSFFHSSLLCTFSCHPSPPTILPSSLTSSCHLFLGLPLNFVVPKFIYNTLLGILFSSIPYTCPNQRNLFNLTVSIIVGFSTLAWISLLVNSLQFSFSLSYTGPKILLYTFLSEMFNRFLSLFVSVQVSDEYVKVFLVLILVSLIRFYF